MLTIYIYSSLNYQPMLGSERAYSAVTCPYCRCDFCYTCGSADLHGTFVRHCPRCDKGYIVHRYLPFWFIAWLLLLPVWVIYSGVALALCGLGLLIVGAVRCVCSASLAKEVFLCIFFPFVVILDLLFQTCHCSCKCGPCFLPITDEDSDGV
jgi:hypothetical protein